MCLSRDCNSDDRHTGIRTDHRGAWPVSSACTLTVNAKKNESTGQYTVAKVNLDHNKACKDEGLKAIAPALLPSKAQLKTRTAQNQQAPKAKAPDTAQATSTTAATAKEPPKQSDVSNIYDHVKSRRASNTAQPASTKRDISISDSDEASSEGSSSDEDSESSVELTVLASNARKRKVVETRTSKQPRRASLNDDDSDEGESEDGNEDEDEDEKDNLPPSPVKVRRRAKRQKVRMYARSSLLCVSQRSNTLCAQNRSYQPTSLRHTSAKYIHLRPPLSLQHAIG